MYIKQISIFLENRRGALRELTELLAEENVDLMALSIADTESYGIVRCVVAEDQITPTLELLREKSYTAKVNNVICVKVPDHPGGLAGVLALLEDADISVEYLYSFFRNGTIDEPVALLVLRLTDPEKAVALFTEKKVTMLSQAQVDAL